ncbi:MAG: TIM barrel protein [Oscillospiraceae bacterium]|nr:TIM barrel protein [Bacteroidales bacterium]MBQ2084708.1 TIM barrel protein [Oscillospiraceae bacterium]MBQ3999388.1 TIM barrel protein [Oscillospiraceae bacterium]MBQ5412222.1 TIM barrel protein [Oscillospiraceae bacterium]
MGVRFGPAGNSNSFADAGFNSTLDAPAFCASMGLDAYEYQCGLGVRVKHEMAEKLRLKALENGVQISLHAPYYISLSSLEEEKRKGSARYFLESAEAVKGMGGTRFVVHSGSCGKQSREQALALAVETLRYCLDELDAAGFTDVTVCPETMGKIGQLGTLEEVLELCSVDERIIPCIDFGHLNARTMGGIKGREDYEFILDTMAARIGTERASVFHSHFSKIEYTSGGEKRHLTFEDTVFGPEPQPLMRLIAERGWSPTFICESDGTQAEDAQTLRKLYMEELEKI